MDRPAYYLVKFICLYLFHTLQWPKSYITVTIGHIVIVAIVSNLTTLLNVFIVAGKPALLPQPGAFFCHVALSIGPADHTQYHLNQIDFYNT